MIETTRNHSWTSACATVWILLSAWFGAGVFAMACLGFLNRPASALILFTGVVGALLAYHRLNRGWLPAGGIRWRRFRKPFPLLFLLCLTAAAVGGMIHAPTNHDGLCYRVPRVLHWLAENRWHWIGSADLRMDFSAAGFESQMLPAFAALHTLRFAFLINLVSYLLLPGLIFKLFCFLGIRPRISALWMWIIPCGSCFALQAGSIGNDLPACAYVLAALMFSFRAAASGSRSDIALAVLSAALMTGTKASNLPLLLPIAIVALAALRKHPRLIPSALAACVPAACVSFLPMAIANHRHTGDWTGSPGNPLKISNPLAGLAGNMLMVGSAALAPAVFPQAEKFNTAFDSRLAVPPLDWISNDFKALSMTHPQLASEENSGLGLGVSASMLLALLGAGCKSSGRPLPRIGVLVMAGFWIALLFYMAKLGNRGAPRLLAPYYPGLLALPLAFCGTGRVFRKRWWKLASLAALLPLVPALMINPARPLLPMRPIIHRLQEIAGPSATLKRMEVVYETYAKRHDPYREVRDLLPAGTKRIAFSGTSNESQYSFWLPLGERRVIDYMPGPDHMPPDPADYDAIVASDQGVATRFGITVEELADRFGWSITGSRTVRALASGAADRWSVIVPRRQPDGPQ